MLKDLIMFGMGWFIYTKTGRKTAKNICMNCIPYIEKEMGIQILKPIKELTKDPCELKEDKCTTQ